MVLVLSSTVPDEVEKIKNDLNSTFEKRNINVTLGEDWGDRRLYHPDKELNSGFYQFYNFEAEPDKMSLLTNDLRVNQGVHKTFIKQI